MERLKNKCLIISEARKLASKLEAFGISFSYEDVVNKHIFNIVKNGLAKDIAAYGLFLYNPYDNLEMIKRFFPCSYEKIKDKDFKTAKFYFDTRDEKFHWVVKITDEEERCFKLKSDNYLVRTEEERKAIYENLKKEIDKLYGYWCTDQNHITDGAIINGEYRILNLGEFIAYNDIL